MPRSGEQARRRLQQAALDLYREQGFEGTTTAEIAARAGVTERTFFRHFGDKREVLFDGEAALRADLERGVADAPAGLDPLEVLWHAFGATLPLLRANRAFSHPRHAVIAATPALRERELAKEASLIEALTAGLAARGTDRRRAGLAAHIGWAAFGRAMVDWLDEPGTDLAEHLRRAGADVRALSGGPVGDRSGGVRSA